MPYFISLGSEIIVFSENVSEEIEQYAKVIKITFPTGYAIPMAYRLMLGEKLIEEYEYDNILHIDVDTIIVENIDNKNGKYRPYLSLGTKENLTIN